MKLAFTATSSTRPCRPRSRQSRRKWQAAAQPAEAAELDKYHKDGVKQIANVKIPQGAVYAVAFRPGGKTLAAAGSDGKVRLINPENGSLVKEFAPVTVKPRSVGKARRGQLDSSQAG